MSQTRPSARKRGYGVEWERYRKRYIDEHRWCAECERHGVRTPSETVDHRKPHKGDQRLFWDPANHAASCLSCNSRKCAAVEGGFGNEPKAGAVPYAKPRVRLKRGCDETGNPIDPRHRWNNPSPVGKK